MIKKIAILGSTGSIGVSSLKIFEKDKKNFKILLLSAKSNFTLIKYQIKKYNPKYFVISDPVIFKKTKKIFRRKKIIIFNNFTHFQKKKFKFDITISAIVGIAGLEPTLNFTKISKKILIANKETVICGWDLIKKMSTKYKTEILPVDSEHFSIKQLTINYTNSDIEKIYITASGGPFLNTSKSMFKKIKPKEAIKHPKWKMGKKISVDSSNLMNKVLEVIEASKLFPFDIKKYKIVIHPQSLIHAIVIFKNGQTKILYHETDMQIPIANSIYENKINIEKLKKNKNNFIKNFSKLELKEVDNKKFPIITLLKKPNTFWKNSAGIILNASNEVLVDNFLKERISFNSIYHCIKAIFKDRDFNKYAVKKVKNVKDIYKVDQWARKKTIGLIR